MNIVYSLPQSGSYHNNKINGVIPGVVTNNDDPDKLGRVKVKFVLRETQQESDWIRIASPMAGPQRGMFCLPEVNDEVLLAFNNGNIEEPFIIGALWNTKDQPPETAAVAQGKVNIRKIKTRIGHEMIFNDEQGKEKIEVHTPKGKKILLDDTSGSAKIEIVDDNAKNKLTIDTVRNTITMMADTKVTVQVKNCTIVVDGSSGITISAPSGTLKLAANQINIEATSAMTVKSTGNMDVQAGAMMNIKGAMVKIN